MTTGRVAGAGIEEQQRTMSSGPVPAPAPVPATANSFDQIPGPTTLPFVGLAAQAHLLPRIGVYHAAACPAWLEAARARYGDVVRLGCSGDLPRMRARRRVALLLFQPHHMAQVYESGCTQPARFERSPLAEQRSEIPGDTAEVFSPIARRLLAGAAEADLVRVADRLVDRVCALHGRERATELNGALEEALYAWAVESLACCAGEAPARAPDALLRVSRDISARAHLQRSERTLRRGTTEYRDALSSFRLQYRLCEEWAGVMAGGAGRGGVHAQGAACVLSDILLAGVDALVHSGTRLLYYLALNLAKQQRLRDELASCGGGAAGGGGARYVRACVRESLRLHGACAVVRRSTAPLDVAGYSVPQGVDIVLAHQIASRSERQFGRAGSFVPERWACERGSPMHAGHAHPAASCPWGARGFPPAPPGDTGDSHVASCPARGAAERALAALVTRLVAQHSLEWHGPPAQLVTAALHYMPPPYHFVLQKA